MPCRCATSDNNVASPTPISPMIARFCVTLQLRRVEAMTSKRGVVLSPDICPAADRSGAKALCRRQPGDRTRRYGLCARFHHHRPVPVALSVGALPFHQGGCEDAHIARPARQYPKFYRYYRWQTARRQRARSARARAGRHLFHGPRLYRLCPPQHVASGDAASLVALAVRAIMATDDFYGASGWSSSVRHRRAFAALARLPAIDQHVDGGARRRTYVVTQGDLVL